MVKSFRFVGGDGLFTRLQPTAEDLKQQDNRYAANILEDLGQLFSRNIACLELKGRKVEEQLLAAQRVGEKVILGWKNAAAGVDWWRNNYGHLEEAQEFIKDFPRPILFKDEPSDKIRSVVDIK